MVEPALGHYSRRVHDLDLGTAMRRDERLDRAYSLGLRL
jgi:hypothetical protein